MEQPIQILIVDDRPENLSVLETILDDPGYRLVRAESADQALLALVAEEFALLILDIRMPGMGGIELAQLIKERKKTATVPIIFLTAHYTEDQGVLEGYGAGAVDFLHKPVNATILRSKVAVFAELHRNSRALAAEVAERRRAELLLRDLNDTLEQRVAERTLALAELNATLEQRVLDRTARLEEANRELESFSYSVSHDLRAPLRAVTDFSRILVEDHGDRLDDEGRRLATLISMEGQRMSRLIDALLEFSRLGRQAVGRAAIDMTVLAREAFAEASATAGTRAIEFRLGELPRAAGERILLRQVFVNLFSNAVKFTRPRTEAVVETGGRVEADQIVYWVRDNGAGFDPRYAEKLFGVFQRLHRQEEFEGTGIGLALVQRIVHRHGGRTWAEGALGDGATFYFSLPIASGERNAA